jgi:hypothetical protein
VQTSISRFTSRGVSIAKKATGDRSEPAVERGEGGFADWVIVTSHALREFKSSSYRALLDELSQMDDVVRKLDLAPGGLPDFTTVCARYQDLKMAVWRTLRPHTADFFKPWGVHAIDATEFDRRGASRRYANRTNNRSKAAKTTAIVDCEKRITLAKHCSMDQPHG